MSLGTILAAQDGQLDVWLLTVTFVASLFIHAGVSYERNLPDYYDDFRTGKRTLAVRIGLRAASYGYAVFNVAAFLFLAGSIVIAAVPLAAGMAFLALPLAWRGIRIVWRHYQEPAHLLAAGKVTLALYLWTSTLIIVGNAIGR